MQQTGGGNGIEILRRIFIVAGIFEVHGLMWMMIGIKGHAVGEVDGVLGHAGWVCSKLIRIGECSHGRFGLVIKLDCDFGGIRGNLGGMVTCRTPPILGVSKLAAISSPHPVVLRCGMG